MFKNLDNLHPVRSKKSEISADLFRTSRTFNGIHHAYLLVGDARAAENLLQESFNLTGSPDYFVWKDALFGIDEARSLSEAAAKKAFTGRKIFFVAPERITLEAQNALLKTFEDPYPNTHFFLVMREEELIIPTLRSRMQIVYVQHSVLHNGSEARKFLSMSIKERLKFIKKFVDDEKSLSKFLDDLLLLLRDKKIYKARLFSDDRSASARLILEHLALVLP